jgi:uncharacterized damage-inducible protein DinB
MDVIDSMLAYDRWATTTLLEASGGLSDAQLDQELDAGHGTLRATFAHIIVNIEFWSGFMLGAPRPPDETLNGSLAELIERHERAHDAFAAVSRQLRDAGRLDETYVDHYDANKSMGGTILNILFHNAEHRTEAQHMLKRLGLPEVPEVDYGLWDYLQWNA